LGLSDFREFSLSAKFREIIPKLQMLDTAIKKRNAEEAISCSRSHKKIHVILDKRLNIVTTRYKGVTISGLT
jgi:hypothetical protein